ncbi:MAG: hypothetical protein NTX50_22285, partial [Candidatus Sumerlaeota bacterium]|nr:hypothetical protein [Candidatus Sumerlaeota bacterium]
RRVEMLSLLFCSALQRGFSMRFSISGKLPASVIKQPLIPQPLPPRSYHHIHLPWMSHAAPFFHYSSLLEDGE